MLLNKYPSVAYRRLIKEIKYLDTKKYNYNLSIIHNGYILELKHKNYNLNIKISYNERYPFIPPSYFLINDKNSQDYYKKIINQNKDIFTRQDCICCKSLLCVINWNPTLIITDILNETYKILDWNKLVIYKRLLKTIINKLNINQDINYLFTYLI